ncbi:Phosphatidylethanolamine N-methyltransferase [Gracilariopsis chorda]|uniref:Phosphatidylethanolamine N-methyltransferase n=1 Tax=Gracilariopsis chorda TaxID=448386 RepID=A0A2V3J1N4_9FLOR|nr:Phosphatidylethanolamine N-methyltransferase [Gracilariopsis chorda]|eukprot:PXF48259.1 Phosphatidylethanolamine N-methyltransferase [Gracilariopsis chorda]
MKMLSRKGRSPTGFEFDLPCTTDMFQTLMSPRKWGPAEHLTILLMLVQLLTLPIVSLLPRAHFVLVFAFWRMAYNLGIARLLYVQSKRNAITNWLQSLSPSARALVHWASTKSMDDDYAWEKLPACYNAWIAFRALSMVILTNDGFSYFLLAISCFNPFHTSPLWQLAVCIPLGLAFFILSFWSKGAAHHVLGDFAWYWGDFFFTVDADLKFDGVFELFPHPMYTVGYAAYYGAALICRSYTLLALSLLAHIAQLVFLALVEEPHIQKIYGPKTEKRADPKPSVSESSLKSVPSLYEEFVHAAPRLPVVLSLTFAFSTVTALAISARPSTAKAVYLLFFWCIIHWTALTFGLPSKEGGERNLWMRWYNARGYSTFQAFSTWQHVYLVSFMMKHALFLIAASTFAPSKPLHRISMAETISDMLVGISLIAIAIISLASTWQDLGYFGFFYGDFFVKPERNELQRAGMFRYITNPEATLGYLVYYGMAFVRQSRGLFVVAAICQVFHLVFVSSIEAKHIEVTYETSRVATPLEKATVKLPIVSTLHRFTSSILRSVYHYMGTVGKKQAQQTVHHLSVRKDRLKADLNKSLANARDKHVKPRTEEWRSRAESVVGDLNCDAIVSMLGNRGIIVEPVSQCQTEGE